MEKLAIVWEKPFKFNERIPKDLRAAIGLYLLETDSKVLYVGKSEEQGGFKRAKDHLKGQMDNIGKCVVEETSTKDRRGVNIWVGWLEEGENRQLINDAEKLLIWYCNPPCNKTNRGKYEGRPLQLDNEGNYPKGLPCKIQSPFDRSVK